VIILTIGTLLPITNPFSTAPLLIGLTAGWDPREQRRQAFWGCVYAFLILAVFLLLGSAIISFFGISVPGIRVAGGLIITSVGFGMLNPKPAATADGSVSPKRDIAFSPIAMPSLAGPGAISVVLSAAEHIRSIRPEDWGLIYAAIVIGIAANMVLAFVILRAANWMTTFLGKGGIDAMTRIFGFLIICVGMQFLLTGIHDFFGLPGAVPK